MPKVDPLALDRQVCFALAATSRAVIGLYRPVLEPLGLTHPQYLVMLALWEHSPRTVRDLGETLYLEPATLSPLLKRLEQAGLVTRSRNATDERALDVALTAEGAALRARAEAVPGTVVERLGMPVAELESIRDSLTGLLDRIGEPPSRASGGGTGRSGGGTGRSGGGTGASRGGTTGR